MVAPVTYAMEYLRPGSVEDAFARLIEGGAALVAGGVDVSRHPTPEITTLIDLSQAGLDYISEDSSGIRVGAMTTLTDLVRHPAIEGIGGGFVSDMLRVVGSPLLRNLATIGGHLARGRLSDIVPVLLVLETRIATFDGELSVVDLADYFARNLHDRPHVITELLIPSTTGKGAFLKYSVTAFDLAMLNCACLVELANGAVAVGRVAVGETPWLATRLEQTEARLVGGELNEPVIRRAASFAATEVRVGSDLRASAGYRRHLTSVAVSRCLERLAADLEEAG